MRDLILQTFLFVLLIHPLSLSAQNSFSLSVDVDGTPGDQAVTSLDVFPNRTVPIQIFATDIGSANNLSLRFEYDPAQVAYSGFKRSNIASGTFSVTGKDFAKIGITLSAGNAISGLIGTIRFRTTETFSGTDIRLVQARLVRGGQSETVSMDLSVTLRVAKPPSPDFDRSGRVGIPDFLLFVDVFGSQIGQDTYDSKYDLDVDGEIGIPDFLLFMDSFGKMVNRTPIFTSGSAVMLSVDENTAPGQAIGDPITASDADGNTLTYRLNGADADSFAIDGSTGQIQTKGTYNFEQQNGYSPTVHVSDGEGGEASLAVDIAISDIDEPPEQPAPPSVSAIAPTSLTVIWTEPVNTGPEITDYDVQYRQADSDAFTDAEYDGTERSLRLTGLSSSTRYEIQVRATNEEGMSEWSESGEWTTSELSLPPGGGDVPPPPPPPPPPSPPPPPPPTTSEEVVVKVPAGIQVGMQAPDFTLRTLTGESFNLYEQRGTPVFLNFWATWCSPCLVEMPDIQKLQDTMGASIQIVGIGVRDTRIRELHFTATYGFTWTFVLDSTGDVSGTYGVTGIPTSYFLDARGVIVRKFVGARNYETFLEATQQAIDN